MAKRKVVLGDSHLAVGYIRVSKSEQHLGPEAQRSAMEHWCADRGVTLVAVFSDLGVSGGATIDKRPGLLDALNGLRAHKAGLLLVQKRDRLAREVTHAAAIEGLAESSGAVVTTTEGDAGDDPNAWLLRTFKDMLAQYERLQIKARTRAALAVKKARGERVGGVPIGRTLDRDGVHLVDHPVEALVVARVHALKEAGHSLRGIARVLESERVPARGERWHPTTVARILTRSP